MCTWPKLYMHVSNNHTHETGGAWVPMNGGDWRGRPIRHGGAREEGIGVPTGAQRTLFAAGGKRQENAQQKEDQQNSKKQRKHRGEIATKRLATGVLTMRE